LLIRATRFPKNIVSLNWFEVEDDGSLPKISKLEFQECPGLKEFEGGALAKFPFGINLRSFTLSRNKALSNLTTGITQGLTALDTLNLSENDVIVSVDEDFFIPFKGSLQVNNPNSMLKL
jgi:hypothetical protein